MADFLFNGISGLLSFFYAVYPSYGVAIVLLTLAVMILCFPLTAKGTRSMVAMTRMQPEMKRIQQKYKDDRQKQHEELMALWKQHGATPFGGCLPMLVQAPVFLVMWRVLVGLLKKTPEGLADPSYLDHSSQLYRALVRDGGEMVWLGFDLAKNASTALDRSVGTAVPYFLLILAVMATTYYQQRQVQARNPNAAKLAAENPQLAMTQRIMKIFPLMYGIFGFTIPAGVMVYLLVSNLFRIFQQALLYKFDPRLSFPEVAADEAAPPPEADAKPAPTKAEAKAPKTTKATTPPKGKPTGKPPAVAPPASAPAKNGANGRRPSQSRSQGRKQPKKRSR